MNLGVFACHNLVLELENLLPSPPYNSEHGVLFQVIKLKPSGNQYTYFLHYMGWNSRWDKWVLEADLMAAGPEALEMQKQLKKQKKEKVS